MEPSGSAAGPSLLRVFRGEMIFTADHAEEGGGIEFSRDSVMSSEGLTKDRPLAPGDPALHPGWRLLRFLLSLGADEFSLRFTYAGDDGKDACDRLARRLAFASLGERIRECTVTYGTEGNPRPVYQRGELLFGTVTHEQFAFLRLSDDEWSLWWQTDAAR